jgi:hypothetical protein
MSLVLSFLRSTLPFLVAEVVEAADEDDDELEEDGLRNEKTPILVVSGLRSKIGEWSEIGSARDGLKPKMCDAERGAEETKTKEKEKHLSLVVVLPLLPSFDAIPVPRPRPEGVFESLHGGVRNTPAHRSSADCRAARSQRATHSPGAGEGALSPRPKSRGVDRGSSSARYLRRRRAARL